MRDDVALKFREAHWHGNPGVRKVADLALRWHTDATLQYQIPAPVLTLYPMAFARLADYLTALGPEYPPDHLHKDMDFVTGVAVPVTASHTVDLNSRIGYRASLALARERPLWPHVRQLMMGRPTGPWLRIHTEPRWLDDFNEAGWDNAYRQCARLLRANRASLGLAATSWFNDPAMREVSPHLTYLRDRLLERGAICMRVGTSQFDLDSALAKSNTRRVLYETGRYMPTAYTLLWPRAHLLDWARQG